MEVSMSMSMQININQGVFSKNPKPIISCQLASMQSGKTNFYQLLSLSSQNVGFDEIKKAYKSMVLQYHPDVCNSSVLSKEESTKRFIELRKAYETLSDPNARRVYDRELGSEDPLGHHFGRRESCLSREVWEMQLNGLRKKSGERMKKKRSYN
ncbi:hypothetical protein CDL12_00464 [Handroanthus impetiginosus]|uniref:J domain-containing protein n=1 Tax=Handroanthus impetiginosus TaxID=429701 RepID=A0A2G9IAG8_9LAMI|nr:hypothetical protein CDL12_00464 [Handroanthus impetiginosus]